MPVMGSDSQSNAWFGPSVGQSVGRRLIGVRSYQQVVFLQAYWRRACRFIGQYGASAGLVSQAYQRDRSVGRLKLY